MSERLPMGVNFPGLVRLLAEHLYPERSVFVREMVQNAHDSLCRRRAAQPAHAGRIDVLPDAARRTIAFVDNGTGMTADEIRRFLNVLGQSGTGEMRRRMAHEGRPGLEGMIGQFGVGLLSGFLVADRIVVETRPARGRGAWRWTYDGGEASQLEEIARPDFEAGTRVVLHIAPRHVEFLQPQILRDAIVRYADFLAFPIHLGGGPAPVNAMEAPWHRTYAVDEVRLREYHRFLGRRFPDMPLEVIPIDAEKPCRLQGVLYISDQRLVDAGGPGSLDVYCKRMFVCAGDTVLLPPWARFVRGVIDSPDLTITVARSSLQQGAPDVDAIRALLGRTLLDHLAGLAARDPRHFERIMKWQHHHVRRMALEHDDFFDAVADLVPFETAEGLMNLGRYLERHAAPDGRVPVYYFTQPGAGAQVNELCAARGIVALDASYAYDEAFLEKYAGRHEDRVELHRVDGAGLSALFEPLDDEEDARYDTLARAFDRILNRGRGDDRLVTRVERFEPSDLPAVVTLSPEAEARRRLGALQSHPLLGDSLAEYAREIAGGMAGEPLVLHLNANSPLVEQLAAGGPDGALEDVAPALFHGAVLLSSRLQDERDLRAQYRRTMALVETLLEQRETIRELRRQIERRTG